MQAMKMLTRMGITMFADLPFIAPMIVVLVRTTNRFHLNILQADFREGFYTDRIAGSPEYFPTSDWGDRAKRLLKGATGAYEAAIIQGNFKSSFYSTLSYSILWITMLSR